MKYKKTSNPIKNPVKQPAKQRPSSNLPIKKERLQKVLSQAGFGARRLMEEWITAGRVKVNGSIALLGSSAGPDDKIAVDGKPIRNPLSHTETVRVLLYHKPIGEICSRSDPDHLHTVFDKLPDIQHGRWVMVGRLDLNTSGLLIFTNNGALANELMHPRFGLEREYAVRVRGLVSDQIIKNLCQGVTLEDGLAKFKSIEFRGGDGANSWYHVVITEGKNREVRRLWESQQLEVSRLMRVRYGNILLPRTLARGQYIELSSHQITQLIGTMPQTSNSKPSGHVKKPR